MFFKGDFMKKALSLFLVALLVFSFSVFPAYAADGDEDPLTAINNIIALWDDPYGSVFPTIVADQGYYGSTAQLLRQALSNHPSGRKP